MIQKIFNNVMSVVSLLTAFGVFMHDGRVDKAAMTAMNNPFSVKYFQTTTIGQRFVDFTHTDAHTHPDHNAAKNLLSNTHKYSSPSLHPRRKSHHKQLLRELEGGGRHAFDDRLLPMLA